MANMNVFAVIVLLMTLNLLSCAKIDRATMTAAEAATRTSAAAAISPTMSTTPNEFLNSPTATAINNRRADESVSEAQEINHEFDEQHDNNNFSKSNSRGNNSTFVKSTSKSNAGDATKPAARNTKNTTDNGQPPHFTRAINDLPERLHRPSGNTVKIRCPAAVSMNVPWNITWTKDAAQIVRARGQVDYRKWSIFIDDLMESDSGAYMCKVCNLHGCVNFTTRLQVQDRSPLVPILLEGLQNATKPVGSTHTFECHFVSDTPFFTVQWMLGTCVNCTNTKILQTAARPNQLTLSNITHDNEGWYTCVARNSLGYTSANAYLHVVDDLSTQTKLPNTNKNARNIRAHERDAETKEIIPEYNDENGNSSSSETSTSNLDDASATTTENQDNDEASEPIAQHDADTGVAPYFIHEANLPVFIPRPSGNMVKIKCPAAGNPSPNITWHKDSAHIVRTHGQVVYRKWAIILEDLTQKDSGAYTCTVCNLHGCANHTTQLRVQERVNHKPILSEQPQNATEMVGTTHTFRCEYISDLHLSKVQWVLGTCLNCSDTKVLKTDPEKSEELVLQNITHDDEGWYTCVAANSLGHTAASAYLHVVDDLDEILMAADRRFRSVWGYVIVISMGALFLVAIFIMLIGFRKLKREKLEKHRAMETVHQWTKKVIIVKPSEDEVDGKDGIQMPVIRIEKQRTTMHQSQYCNDPSLFNEYEFPLDSNWEFPRNHLKFGPTLGEGEFGRVIAAEAYGLTKPQETQIVAVKMVKEGHTDADVASLVREMEVMKMIGKHINIINLLGCCSQNGPLYVIVEYAPHGNLKDYLKKNLAMSDYNSLNTSHLLTQKELTSFAYQVARGMDYLSERRYIHRDLAARNVLVCDNHIVKIADFGLARDLQESEYYRKSTNGKLPFKWIAPESFWDKFYDSQSDVWSFGVLLWEIFSFAEQPYPHIYCPKQLYKYLDDGNRMEKPARCPINIYALMRQCWNFNAQSRPKFFEIVDTLENVLTTSTNEEYLDLINVPYLDETSSLHSEDDQDIVDGFDRYPACRPFLNNFKYDTSNLNIKY